MSPERAGREPKNPVPARAEIVARRHDAIYGRPGLPRFQVWPVAERVFAGRNPLSEADVLELRRRGVSHLLDLREEPEWRGPGRLGQEALDAVARLALHRKWLPIPDGAAPETVTLRAAADWLDTVLAARETAAFVHCRAGLERTATVLVAWLGRRDRLEVAAALARLRDEGYPGGPLAAQAEAAARFLRLARR